MCVIMSCLVIDLSLLNKNFFSHNLISLSWTTCRNMKRKITEVITTPDSLESQQELGISEDNFGKIKNYVLTFNFNPTKRSIPLARSKKLKWEVWRSRIGHPDANRGKRYGFRMVHFYNFEEERAYIGKIWPKGDTLGKKGEKQFEKYVAQLHSEIIENWGD